MGNMCCRREIYVPNGTDTDQSRCGHHQQQSLHQLHPSKHTQPQHPAMSSAYHSAGDDCAINELLEGRMDLDVLMPDGRKVRLTVERRTPMMDLLVQAASATKISPGGHVIHVFGDGDKANGTLQYKPSTPIGSLDTNTIFIVPKKEAGDPQARRMGKTANRPFEPTFRVQVHLPRNQLTVLRVSPRVKVSELKSMVCKEKGLDISRYQLVRPSAPTQPLTGEMTLAEYGSTEITLLSNSSIESHICNSTSHIMPYSKRNDEQKRKTGILRLLTEDVNCKNTNSNCIDGNHRNNLTKSEDTNGHQPRFKPKKRRPAPPPPPPVLPEAPSHSRQSSSDSSGYHEATSSFLHEEHSGEEKASSDSSGVSSLDAKIPSIQPTTPPSQNLKKKKAPAPPPPKEKVIEKETIIVHNTTKKEHVNHKKPAPKKDPVIKEKFDQMDSIIKMNPETKLDYMLPKDNSFLTNQIIQNVITAQTNSVMDKSPVILEDLAALKHSIPQKKSVSQENLANLNDGLTYKVHLSQDHLIQKDPIPTEDHIVLPDHVILKNQVLKQDTHSEKKLDLSHISENEGHRLQSQLTVAAKELPATGTSTDPDAVKETKCEGLSEILDQTQEGRTVVLDTSKNRRPSVEQKVEKSYLSCRDDAVSTRVALVALNARIEQDVTQQEIASSIQAAFHSVDCSPQPSLLAIKQRNNEESTAHNVQDSHKSTNSSEVSRSPKTIVRVSSYLESNSRKYKEPLFESSTELKSLGKEDLLIDEEPPPRPGSACSISSTKPLKRSSSLLNFADVPTRNISSKNTKRIRHLQRSLSDLSADDREDFEAEQERLQREYIKLQRQFILWQQQLMNNHAMLREECIVPQYARTLRQSHSLPEGEDYSETTPSPPPLVSRSLSYEPTKERCSTLPRSTINIPSLEFGSIPLNNGTSTLRSSKTKSYFKPPQIRASTKSRQRLPPEIRKEGDVDITDDAKMLTTILPSFESLKLITENTEEDIHSSIPRLKDTSPSTKPTPVISQENKKLPLVHKSSTFPKLNSRMNNGDLIADKDQKCVNGDTGHSKLPENGSKINEQSLNSQLPPPPPPMPVGGVTKSSVQENCIKSSGQRNGIGKKKFTPDVDPREQLMLEIRKFGGRTALRKISLAS